jgi:hypothetical protein
MLRMYSRASMYSRGSMDSRVQCLLIRAVLMEVDTHRDLIAKHHRLLLRMGMLGGTHSLLLNMGQSTEDEGDCKLRDRGTGRRSL